MQLTQGSSRIYGPRVRPNPLLKLSPNGVSPGPGRRYVVHSRHPGPASLARTLGLTRTHLAGLAAR